MRRPVRGAVWAIARHLVYVPIVVWAKVMQPILSGFMYRCVKSSRTITSTIYKTCTSMEIYVAEGPYLGAKWGHGMALAAITQPDDSRVHARPCRPCRLRHSIVTPKSVRTGSNGSRTNAGFMSVLSSRTGQLSLLFTTSDSGTKTSSIVIWGYQLDHLFFSPEV